MGISLLVKNCSELITLAGKHPRKGVEMENIGIIKDGAVAISNEGIEYAGKTDEVIKKVEITPKTEIIDATGKLVMPGFVDPHTHLVFAGTRETEFELRLKGLSYEEIAKRGGGIKNTVRATREASEQELLALAKIRLDRILEWGTTTVEIKSGYGLDFENEMKLLRVIDELNRIHPMEIASTFLGAHEVPEEQSKAEYINLIKGMIVEVSKMSLAEFCDVFCERGVFSYDESLEILKFAKRHKLGLKVHADELSTSGGSLLAGKLGAISADHLVYPSPEGLQLMKKRGVVAVLLPGTSLTLKSKNFAPARKLIDMEIPVALATDFNPGTCLIEGMVVIIGLGCLLLGMTPAETITSSTINAACAIGRGDRIGSIEKGKQADIIILNIPNYKYLSYRFTTNFVKYVIKKGKVVVSTE